jgi:hypothetical protein
LRPTNGATALDCTLEKEARLTIVTAEEDIIEEAIFLLTFLVHKSKTLLLELKSFYSYFLFIMFRFCYFQYYGLNNCGNW